MEESFTVPGHSGLVNAVALTARGERALTATMFGEVKAWDLEERRELWRHNVSDIIDDVALSANPKWAAAVGRDMVYLWHVETGEEFRRLPIGGRHQTIAFSADGGFIAVASGSGLASVWNIGLPREVFRMGLDSVGCSLAIGGEADFLVVGDLTGSVYRFDLLQT